MVADHQLLTSIVHAQCIGNGLADEYKGVRDNQHYMYVSCARVLRIVVLLITLLKESQALMRT